MKNNKKKRTSSFYRGTSKTNGVLSCQSQTKKKCNLKNKNYHFIKYWKGSINIFKVPTQNRIKNKEWNNINTELTPC